MNTAKELIEEDSTDTSDDDYVPEKKSEVLSEVESDGDSEDNCLSDTEIEDQDNRKRKKNSRNCRKKKKTEPVETLNENSKELSEEEKKKRDEDIWADFMKDTGFQSRKNINSTMPSNKINSIQPLKSDSEKFKNLDKPEEKVKITKIFEFAGEEVTVEKEVSVDSAEARLLNSNSSQTNQRSRGGLSGISGILNQLGKKPKISTLEKSKLDWDKFKKEENLEEELQTYNKGKDGYLERQDFLQRADLRRFEIEKEIRTTERNRRMNNSL